MPGWPSLSAAYARAPEREGEFVDVMGIGDELRDEVA
jgi:hypothetical protein